MITIIALTPTGQALGERLALALDGARLLYQPKPFRDSVQQLFRDGQRLIFICATGIVVRTLAPVLQDKHRDPPVLVLDEAGRFVIPLLSGHEGGANAWGQRVAQQIGAELVLTTAQSYLSAPEIPSEPEMPSEPEILSESGPQPELLTQAVYTLGMGCERHCPERVLHGLALECLVLAGLAPEQIAGLASIDLKADEQGLIGLAKRMDWPYTTWTAPQLRQVEAQLSQKSEIVFREVGVYGVAEAAALVAASALTAAPAELILPKHKNRQATCAIARSHAAAQPTYSHQQEAL